MPNTRQTQVISPSPTDPPGAGQSPRSEEIEFSDDGDAVIARFCDLIDKMPATSEDQPPADADEDEALSSVSEGTAVAAALPADLGSRVQNRVREIEDEVLNYCTCPANKVPVEARKFLMARVFEMVAFCSDLRAEAATERGAALALQSQLVEARREVATLQRRAVVAEGRLDGSIVAVTGPGVAVRGPGPSGTASAPCCCPEIGPPAWCGRGAGDDRGSCGGARAPCARALVFLTPTSQTDRPARDVVRLLKTNIDPAAKDISLHYTRYGVTVFSNNKTSVTNMTRAIADNSVTRSALLVRVGEKRQPHVKFSGVDPDIAPQDFLARLSQRNPDLDLDLEKSKVRVTFRERAGTCAYIAEVNPAAFHKIMSRPRLSLGWTTVRASEDLHVPTCTFCASYGHGRSTCPVRDDSSKAACMRCAGPHLGSACRVRMGDAEVCCVECRRAGLPCTSHPAGHPECPTLRGRVARIRARTNYGA
ncbi:hypothetical protein HPB49_012602 [Dermacentor silvarum]|uniref:Uncharacterized protein n=1 Tax=Dermacentor silvarum TaxID=543639 RepID=A0ACB8C3Q9_DERSI|nr:hypothetical protein HPB49_012602 [Dermacentor silvarum]